jgi:hypothetical protein
MTQRGLCDIQQHGSLGEVELFGEHTEVAKVAKLHGGQ